MSKKKSLFNNISWSEKTLTEQINEISSDIYKVTGHDVSLHTLWNLMKAQTGLRVHRWLFSSAVLMTNSRWQKSCWDCELKLNSERHKEKTTWQCQKELPLSILPFWKHICVRNCFSTTVWMLICASTGPGLPMLISFNCDLHQGKCSSAVWVEALSIYSILFYLIW